MADYNAGQAYLTILPDLSSFGEKVREELAKENYSASVPVKPELDTEALDAEIADVESKLREISDARSKVEIDDADAKVKIDELTAKLDELQAKRAEIVTKAETADAKLKLDELKAKADELDGKNVKIKAETDTGNSENDINALMAAGISLGPAIIPVAAAVAAALAAIGTGAVIGAASIGAIILGFHGVSSTLQDMDAVQQNSGKTAAEVAAQQISSANSVANAHDGVRNAVRSVEDAQRSAAISNQQATEQVANAQRSLQDTYISTGLSIASALRSETQAQQTLENAVYSEGIAEQSLANAQQQEQLAQESLTLARQAAQRQIESLTLAVEDGALAERQAQLNIQKAKEELDKVLANPAATQLQREQAQLTYDQALQQAKDIGVRNKNNAQDKAAADAKGVEGSQQVQAAQRGVTSATQSVAAAQHGVAQATQAVQNAQVSLGVAQANVDETRRKGAEQIAVAQQNLTDAQAKQAETARAGAEAIQKAQEGVVTAQRALAGALAQQAAQQSQTSASAQKLAQDMSKLSPAGREFVNFFHNDMEPKLKELQAVAQQGLLPGVEQGLKNALPIFPQVKGLVGDLSTEFGSLASRAGSALNDPFWTNWILFIRREAVPSTEIFGQTLGNLATGGAAILQAFAPVWDQMGKGIESWSQKFSLAAQNLQSNPQFQQFMEYIKVNGPIVVHFIGDLIMALVHVGEGLGPIGHVTLEVVDSFLKLINSMPTSELNLLVTVLSLGLTAWQAWKIVSTVAGWVGDFKKSVGEAATSTETWTAKVTGSASAGEKAASAVKGLGAALPILGAAFVAADAAQSAFGIDQDKVVQGLLQGGQAARQAADSFNQQSLFAKILTGSIVGIGPTMDTATKAMNDQLAAMDPLTRAQTLATRARNDYLDAMNRGDVAGATSAQQRYADATSEVTRQQQLLKDGLDKTTDSMKKQQEQLLSASDAEIRWRDALQTVTDGIQQNGATLDLNTAAGRRNQTNVNDLIRAMQSEEDTMKSNGATVDQLTAQHQIFHDQLVNVYTQMGYTQQQAQNLANQYMAIKDIGTIATDFLANTGAAIVAVNDMKNQINGALSQITQEQIMVTFKADTGNILNSATGGAVVGPGTGTSDSVGPVMLSHGEHVLTAAEVSAAGGHSSVFAMRRRLKGMAAGGPVVWQDTSTWNAAGIPDVATANRSVVEHVAQKMRQQEVAPSSSPGVAHWRPISLQALSIAGQDASNLGRLEMQMGTESGGNPTAINKWDINWQKGTPSIGLMQVIGPTYARYHHPNYDSEPHSYGVSEDPLSNILSAIRYTLAAYGSLAAGWQGHGYDTGGWLPPGITMAYNGTGQPERVLTAPQYGALTSAASKGDAQPVVINVYPRAEHSEADIADMVSRRLSFAFQAAT